MPVSSSSRSGALLPAAAMVQAKGAEEVLREMSGRRDAVEGLKASPTLVIDGYSRTNDALLNVVGAALDRPDGNAALSSPAAAWMALLFAKEKKGMERAQLVAAFAARAAFAERCVRVWGTAACGAARTSVPEV